MFLGQYEHSIDEKGRLTIPARFRELLVGGAYVTQGFDENLLVLTSPVFERLYQRINEMNMADPAARQLRRLIFSSAERVDPDKVGRILIPQYLRQTAHLDSTAIVIGVGDYFELWSPERWAQQSASLQDAESNAALFAALDLSLR